MSEEKNVKADETAEPNQHINLTVRAQDNSSVHFKIKRNTPLRRLITAYCDKTESQQAGLKFMFDGAHIQETDTPATLDLEENDTIEVYQHQTGGQAH